MSPAVPRWHRVRRADSKRIQCQMSPGGVRCTAPAKFCEYRRWSSPSPGIAFDYFCPECWRTPGPMGTTPEERATT